MSETEADDEAVRAQLERVARPEVIAGLLAQVDAAVAAAPGEAKLLRMRASLLRRLGRVDEALRVYEQLQSPGDREHAAILAGAPGGGAANAGPARFVRIENVLDGAERAALWELVAESTDRLGPARVGYAGVNSVDRERWLAETLGQTDALRTWFVPRVRELVADPGVAARLGLEPFAGDRYEIQITRHGHGGFFEMHRDQGPGAFATRVLTFVYYFHRLPRSFTGGDLLLFDQDADGMRDPNLGFTRIAPDDNSLVIFASDRLHAVTRIEGRDEGPLDGRWTVNGWLHRPKTKEMA